MAKIIEDGIDAKAANEILIGMVTDDTVLGRIASKWKHKPFNCEWADIIGQWCVTFFQKHHKAPRKTIRSLYDQWADTQPSDTLVKGVEQFLKHLSEQAIKQGEVNPGHVLDIATKHFHKVGLTRLRDQIDDALETGQYDRADEKLFQFNKVDLETNAAIDVEESVIDQAFRSPMSPLIKYPGDVGVMINDAMTRSSFVAFMGPEKSGKCVSENMEVLLADGRLVTVGDLVASKDDTPVITLNETTNKFEEASVSDFWDNGEKECWEVVTRSGRRIETTANHLYLTPEGWRKLEEIQPGDFVAVPKKLSYFGKSNEVTKDEAKFLAYMLAEGCCVGSANKEGRITCEACTFTNADPDITADFSACCNRLGIRLCQNGISYNLSGNARNILRKYRLSGHSAKTKTIPAELFSCPRSIIACFLRVFFSCDGYVLKNGHVGMGLANEKMLRQISHLLLRFGIVHTFKHSPVALKGKWFDAWVITISCQEHIRIFVNEINMLSYKWRDAEEVTKYRSFVDVLPNSVARKLYDGLKEEYAHEAPPNSLGEGRGKYVREGHAFRQMFGTSNNGKVREAIASGRSLMRQSFIHVSETSASYQKYMCSDILWDRVASKRSVGTKKTYDLSVPTHHNFVANDFVVHNSWMLLDAAFRAVMQKRKVAYFEVGDMGQDQVMLRFLARLARTPFRVPLDKWPHKIRYPESICPPEGRGQIASVMTKAFTFKCGLNATMAKLRWAQLIKKNKLPDKPIRFHCSPSGTMTVAGVTSQLDLMAIDGWKPDVVVIDYADILGTVGGKKDEREAINSVWLELRALALSRKLLVLTATQTDADSYDTELISRKNFSGDKRKLAHASGVLGINVRAKEKAAGVSRLNWVVRREMAYDWTEVVHCAGCLAVANPVVVSCF